VVVALRAPLCCFEYGRQIEHRSHATTSCRRAIPQTPYLHRDHRNTGLQRRFLLPVHIPVYPILLLLDTISRSCRWPLHESPDLDQSSVRVLGHGRSLRLGYGLTTLVRCPETALESENEATVHFDSGIGIHVSPYETWH
jgi:hypothetical protein